MTDSFRDSVAEIAVPNRGYTTSYSGDASTAATPSPSFASSLALGVILIGLIAVTLAALPYKTFELDRYFIPKELVLHVTATLATVCMLFGRERLSLSRLDLLFVLYLALTVVSALFATNVWLATRAAAITMSGTALFWVARQLQREGRSTMLLAGVLFATLCGIATSLAQAYGVESQYFSLNRAPGGTFGNRNFVAHVAAIGTPLLLYLSVRAKRGGAMLSGIALVATSAALVLSRSRAAWVALIVATVCCAPLLWRLRRVRTMESEQGGMRRVLRMGSFIGLGVVAALLLPNTLEWKSDSPYLDSVRGVVNYQEGSGRGRLIQYQRTLRLAGQHPVLGVGPGNWPVAYPAIAPAGDPSLGSDGMTANPWPSSDWMAIVSERGPLALAIYVLIGVGLLAGAWRRWRHGTTTTEVGAGITLVATLLIAATVGAFDAVILLAAPTMLVWITAGALVPEMPTRRLIALTPARRRWMLLAVTIVGMGMIARSAFQVYAMALVERGTTNAILDAATFDPGSYRIQMRAAAVHARRGQCAPLRARADAAHRLFPNAAEPRRIVRRAGC